MVILGELAPIYANNVNAPWSLSTE